VEPIYTIRAALSSTLIDHISVVSGLRGTAAMMVVAKAEFAQSYMHQEWMIFRLAGLSGCFVSGIQLSV
jgi:hypothetical protein